MRCTPSAPDSKRHAAAVLQRIATVANDHGVDLASEFSKKDVAQCGLLSLSDAKRVACLYTCVCIVHD